MRCAAPLRDLGTQRGVKERAGVAAVAVPSPHGARPPPRGVRWPNGLSPRSRDSTAQATGWGRAPKAPRSAGDVAGARCVTKRSLSFSSGTFKCCRGLRRSGWGRFI